MNRKPLANLILESILTSTSNEPLPTQTGIAPYDDQDLELLDGDDVQPVLRDPLDKVTEGLVSDLCIDAEAADVELGADTLDADIDTLMKAISGVDTSSEGAAEELNESRQRARLRRIMESDGDGDPEACNDLTASELADRDVDTPSEVDTLAKMVAESVAASAAKGALAAAGMGGAADVADKEIEHGADKAASATTAATKKAGTAVKAGANKAYQATKRAINSSAEDPMDCTDLTASELASIIVDGNDPDFRDPLEKVTESGDENPYDDPLLSDDESELDVSVGDLRDPLTDGDFNEARRSKPLAVRMLEAYTHFAPDMIYTPEEDITTGRGETALAVASKGQALHIDGRPSHEIASYLAQAEDHDDFTDSDFRGAGPAIGPQIDDDFAELNEAEITPRAIATAFAKSVSSQALKVTPAQAEMFMFGSGDGEWDEQLNDHLTSLMTVLGYNRGYGFDRSKYIKVHTPLVGRAMADAAADIVEADEG